MEQENKMTKPDNTAARTALWRAMHVQLDPLPHIIVDEIGFKLLAPADNWRDRPDMDPDFTKRLRASMVARARFVEDLLVGQQALGISQYVILGAGLDTFAQRRTDIASKLEVFEIDQPDTQAWKQQRLVELGFGIPGWLHFVSVNFETTSWWERLISAGFDIRKPAVISCTGVSLYLTKDAVFSMLSRFATLATGSKLAMTFYLPMNLIDEEDKFLQQIAEKGAQAAGTPFISFFTPEEMLEMARRIGFNTVEVVSARQLALRYFEGRPDDFRPASGEEFLVATI